MPSTHRFRGATAVFLLTSATALDAPSVTVHPRDAVMEATRGVVIDP